jgi:hypothetical protein
MLSPQTRGYLSKEMLSFDEDTGSNQLQRTVHVGPEVVEVLETH